MTAASSASDARNPDGAGDGMGANVSVDPAGYFHDTKKTPEWLLTAGHREWTRAQDQAHPDRPCAWCGNGCACQKFNHPPGHASTYVDSEGELRCECGKWLEPGYYEMEDHLKSVVEP